jgi:predicted O-methyltransferase YrrM
MIHTIHRLREFLSYQQRAQTKYYIHSPFVYQFYLNILEGNRSSEAVQKVKSLHKRLLQNYDKILIDDMGATPGAKEKMVSHIAATASMPHKYGMVLYNLAHYFSPQNIIELGTCLGLGTAYLASANPSASVITIEGSTALADLAGQNFNETGLKNIVQLIGNFDEKLPEVLTNLAAVGMAFIDGNHRYEPTLRYFNQLMAKAQEGTILVFDDIYWSPEMTEAWQVVKLDPRISLTIDIYRFGIAFIQKDKLAKEDFTLRY